MKQKKNNVLLFFSFRMKLWRKAVTESWEQSPNATSCDCCHPSQRNNTFDHEDVNSSVAEKWWLTLNNSGEANADGDVKSRQTRAHRQTQAPSPSWDTCSHRGEDERRGHEIQRHNVPHTGFPILATDPPLHPQPRFPFRPRTVPKRRGRVDMKALICWPLCGELLCLSACWSCSQARPHTCGC